MEKGELGRIQLVLLIAGNMFLSPTPESRGLTFTDEGIEKTFQVNYLSNFLLVLLLLQSFDKNQARIVWIGSTSHDPSFLSNRGAFHTPELKILFKDTERLAKVTEGVEKGDEFPAAVRRYGTSKLCMCLWM